MFKTENYVFVNYKNLDSDKDHIKILKDSIKKQSTDPYDYE